MRAKNTYRLFFGPADDSGRIVIDRAAFEREIAATLETGLMDYAPLTAWTGDLVVSALNAEDVDRALGGYATWGSVKHLYPPDFRVLMKTLRERLTADPSAYLTVTARMVPGQVAALSLREKRAAGARDLANPN